NFIEVLKLKRTEIIETVAGKIQGYIENRISVFKGIPYAEPPIGELRLNDPLLKESWNGVLEVLEYGPEAPQHISPITPRPYPELDEEKCLTLNIWTPRIDNDRLPVMVWIHGGGFSQGSGSRVDVLNLAKRGNVVLTTINYRLGAFANLILPNVPGNIDMLDQITALKWIKNNIEYFGGDPKNVTIFGESAGGQSVCILMSMPKAKGLFHKVIAQSGRAMPQGYKFSDRQKATNWLLKELNLQPDDLDDIRNLPIENIIKASVKVQQKATARGIYLAFGPYIDGKNLPKHPLKAIDEGFAKEIDLVIGTNLEEWKFWHLFNPNFKELEAAKLTHLLKSALQNIREEENKVDLVIETYKNSRKENNLPAKPQDIIDAFITDSIFHIPAIKFAEAQCKHHKNTYMYLFSWQSRFRGGIYGAMHGLDIAFVFKRLLDEDRGFSPKRTKETELLSAKMMDAWTSFARTGNPNHKLIPKWPQYNVEERATIVFDNDIRIWEDPLKKEREMWDSMKIWKEFSKNS
ncbi:MAG: carboxylesterase/lipase family protein, partial [Candidatus Thorarchaeota archaeon]